MRWLVLGAAVGGAALLSTASGVGAAESARGEHVYARYCATCHGDRGDGKGPNAFRLAGPEPRDFTRGAYKFRSTPGGSVPRHEDVVRTVAEGVPGTTMPAWKSILTTGDIDAVATYLESFSPRFEAAPDASRTPVRIPPAHAAAPTAQEIEAGRMLYVAFKCWECHGLRGGADGPNAGNLKDDRDQPIAPADLARGVYKSGSRPEDLYRTIATGLAGGEPGAKPSSPMPTFGMAVVVGREGVADLGQFAAQLDPDTRGRVTAFIAALPQQDRIDTLNDDQRAALSERRIWLLVDYVRSLARPRGFFDALFFDDRQHP